jgi:putative sterol carrier protein
MESAREVFEQLPERVNPAVLGDRRASWRFDVEGAGSWRVEVNGGQVSVEESTAEADCVISISEKTLLGIVRGERSPVAAYMTGKVKVQGDTELALRLRDLLA